MKRDREGEDNNAPRNQQTKLTHPFKANFNDHFETSILALRDIYPFLDELRQITRPSCPEAFTLYDPYYCTGKVKETWKMSEFGISKVIHENRDFYADVKNKIAPPLIVRDEVEDFIKDIGEAPAQFDVCVTNPPFSDNHIERFLLDFAIPSRKPWAMLVPDYIASKPWYIKIVGEKFSSAPVQGRNVIAPRPGVKTGAAGLSMGAGIPRMPLPMIPVMPLPAETEAEKPPTDEVESADAPTAAAATTAKVEDKFCQEPFYIVPKGRYDFEHPIQAGRDRSHFKSLWIVSGGRRTVELLKAVKSKSDSAKVTIASGRVELIRLTSAPGTPGSVALIPNPPRPKYNNSYRKY